MPNTTITLFPLLRQALDACEIEHTAQDGKLLLPDGLRLLPHWVETEQKANGNHRTATVVEVWHQGLFPDGLFEYQHAIGPTLQDSVLSGFRSWIQMDLATLREAVGTDKPDHPFMSMTFPKENADHPLERQILFGPTIHSRERVLPEEIENQEGHAFCPCCLFTNSMEAFTDLLKTDRFLGIRLFASRDSDGLCQADCRVNGKDFEAALPLLKAYAERWPDGGTEFRKQYVVIRNKPAA